MESQDTSAAPQQDAETSAKTGNPFAQRAAMEDARRFSEIDAQEIGDKAVVLSLADKVNIIKQSPPSRERALAITKIEEAIMWLETDLKRLSTMRPVVA